MVAAQALERTRLRSACAWTRAVLLPRAVPLAVLLPRAVLPLLAALLRPVQVGPLLRQRRRSPCQ